MDEADRMRVLAPAKINLYLRVGPARADGFHPLVTWMCTVGLFDELTFQPLATNEIRLSCDRHDLSTGPDNLVVKAAAAVQTAIRSEVLDRGNALPGARFGVAAALCKRIPVGAGLGGGSSDGARTLAALNRLWRLTWKTAKLATLAGSLGSDVAFFLYGPSSVCRGRGEQVTPVAAPRPRHCVLILPHFAMPTAPVYREFDRLGLGRQDAITRDPDWSMWSEFSAQELLRVLVNDLEPAAFSLSAELAELRAGCERLSGRPVRMSGSGSSLFTLYDTADEAGASAAAIRAAYPVAARAVALAPAWQDDLADGFGGILSG